MRDAKRYDILKIDPRDHDKPIYVVIESLLPDDMPVGNSGDTWQHDYDVAGAPDRIFRNFHMIVVDGEIDGQMFEYLRTIERPAFMDTPGGYSMAGWYDIMPEAFEDTSEAKSLTGISHLKERFKGEKE